MTKITIDSNDIPILIQRLGVEIDRIFEDSLVEMFDMLQAYGCNESARDRCIEKQRKEYYGKRAAMLDEIEGRIRRNGKAVH